MEFNLIATETFNASLFAHRLKLKQQAMYLSLRDAAKEMGISAATLSRLQREKFTPDVYTYYACCKWLGLDMQFFFR